MSSINFDNAYLLLLAIPFAILLILPFVLAVKKENSNGHNIASCVLHVLMAIAITFTASGTTIVSTVTETDVYVVADVSYSANKNLEVVDNYINQLKDNLPRNSKLGVVCFAKNQQLLVPLGKKIKSVKNADFTYIDDSETDIESALDFANSLFKDDVIKRIVLITDGRQTPLSDSNALKRAVDSLRGESVYIDAVYLDDNVALGEREVQVSSVDATKNAYRNRSEKATVTVQSSYEAQASVSLFKNGVKVATQAPTLKKGYNTLTFDLDTSTSGDFDYEVRLEALEDVNLNNNSVKFTQTVSGLIKMLVVTQEETGDDYALKQFYGEDVEIDSVYPTEEGGLPCTLDELCVYDEIVLSNVDLSKCRDGQAFLNCLDIAVSSFGKSLVTYGNVYTQLGALDTLGDMLPVKYGNSGDSNLYTLVIDSSLSVDTASRFTIAKSAAKQLVNALSEGDHVCVVTFNGSFSTVVPSTTVISDKASGSSKYSSREEVLTAIDSIDSANGTIISFGLEEAYKQIKSLDYDSKQVMLISDGLTVDSTGDAGNEDVNINNVVEKMRKNNMPVSVIDVGRPNVADGSDEAVFAEARLKQIAEKTRGKYFYAVSQDDLDKIMFDDGLLDDVGKVELSDEEAIINVVRSSDEVLDGVGVVNGSDWVKGFVCGKVKPSATTVLSLTYETENDYKELPLYAYWNYGNGRVASFTGKVTGLPSACWSISKKTALFENILTTNTPDEKADYPFSVELREENGYLIVTVVPAIIDSGAVVNATVTLPTANEYGETTLESKMVFSSALYTYKVEASAVGKYVVEIDYTYTNGTGYHAEFSHTVSYLSEYDSFAAFDVSVLHKMIGSEGKVMKNGDKIEVVNEEGLASTYHLNLTVPLLIACVVLFAADVAIRKLKWEDICSLFGKGKR